MGYFFVGGAEFSGAALLQGVLCSDETTNPPIAEASLLRILLDAYIAGKADFERHGPDYFADAEAYRSFHARTVLDFLEQTRNRYAPAAHLVLTERRLARLFPDLHELIPEAKFLLILRDPRDVAAALVRFGEKRKSEGRDSRFATRHMGEIARHYKAIYRPALRVQSRTFRDNLLAVKYEDLAARQPAAIERLRAFTGLALDRLESRKFRSDAGDMAPERESRYAKVLTREEIAEIEGATADVFHLFGYKATAAKAGHAPA